jgi:hypothetical protein
MNEVCFVTPSVERRALDSQMVGLQHALGRIGEKASTPERGCLESHMICQGVENGLLCPICRGVRISVTPELQALLIGDLPSSLAGVGWKFDYGNVVANSIDLNVSPDRHVW